MEIAKLTLFWCKSEQKHDLYDLKTRFQLIFNIVLSTIFVYHEGKLKAQIIGPQTFKNNVSKDQLEWCFFEIGAVPSSMEKNPVDETRDIIKSSIRSSADNDNSKNSFWGE